MGVSKNNFRNKMEADARRVPHWGLRKLSVGVASVLLGTTLYFGMAGVVHADTLTSRAASNQTNVVAKNSTNSGTEASGDHQQVAVDSADKMANDQNQAETAMPAQPKQMPENTVGPTGTMEDNSETSNVNSSAAGLTDSLVETPAGVDNSLDNSANQQNRVQSNPYFVAAIATGNDNVSDTQEDKTVTETINIKDPTTGHTTSHTQSVDFTRVKHMDGSVDAWTVKNGGQAVLPAYSVPTIKGYQAYDADGGDAVSLDGIVKAVHVTGNVDDFLVNVAYRPIETYSEIRYVDSKDYQQDPDGGQTVAVQDIHGAEDAKVDVDSSVLPDGYVLDDDQTIPKTVTITDGMQPVVIKVHQLIEHIDKDHYYNPGDKIDGTKNQVYPTGMSKDDVDRTMTRTINITGVDGTTTSILQKVHATDTIDYNVVTGVITYHPWKYDNGKTTWDAYDVSVPKGQVAIIDGMPGTTVPQVQINPYYQDVVVNVQLKMANAPVQVIYYDVAAAGDQPTDDQKAAYDIGDTTVNAQVGSQVDLSNTDVMSDVTSAGYHLVNPSQKYTITADDNQVVYVPVAETMVTVSHDNPVNPGDKVPDTDDDTFPDGLQDKDLNQTIMRTISTTLPGKPQVSQTQLAYLHRDGRYNEATGEVTYTPWTEDSTSWKVVMPESIPGYTAHIDHQGNPVESIPAVTVRDGQAPETYAVTYTANDSNVTVVFQGDNKVIGQSVVNGKTDDVIADNSEAKGLQVPAGWELDTKGESILDYIKNHYTNPNDSQPLIKFPAEQGTQTVKVVIPVKHHHTLFTHDNPVPDNQKTPTDKVVQGGHQTDLKQTITRMINVKTPDGKTTPTVQTAVLHRDGFYDDVTGEVIYGGWSQDDTNWKAVTPDTIPGYTVHIDQDGHSVNDIPSVVVNDGQQSETITVTYTANDSTVKVIYQDGQELAGQQDLKGKTNQPLSDDESQIKVPDGYELDTNDQSVLDYIAGHYKNGDVLLTKFPAEENGRITEVVVPVKHKLIKVTPDQPLPTDKTTDTNKPVNGAHQADLNQDITRTIKVTTPDGKTTSEIQTAHLTRTATYDDVTGDVTYGDWSQDASTWKDFTPDKVAGYTPSQPDVPAVLVKDGQKSETINITYTANDSTVTVVYRNGQELAGQQDLKGKTDQPLSEDEAQIKVPTGYDLDTNGQSVLDYIKGHYQNGNDPLTKFPAEDNVKTTEVVVPVKHHMTTVTHDNPVPTDKQTVTGKSIMGGHEADLNRTVTRTIVVHTPHHGTTTKTQVAKIFRDGTYDEVTGQVTYGDWSTDTTDWSTYDVPEVPGYTPEQNHVASQMVDSQTQDTTVDINYRANDASMNIRFFDENGRQIGDTQEVKGTVDQTVDVHDNVPDGWMLYSGQTVPAQVTLGVTNDDHDYVVKHLQVFVSSDANKTTQDVIKGTKAIHYPAGVADDQLNKTVTRTINVKMPDGKTNKITQTVHFLRNAIVDAVTGQVTYLSWSENGQHFFSAYVPQPKDGFTVDAAKSVQVTPKSTDSTVDLAYVAVPKTITVEYVTGGAESDPVASQAMTADETGNINFGHNVPAGYVLATASDHVKAGDLTTNVYRVLVRSNVKTYTSHDPLPAAVTEPLTKTVTRTITVKMPNGRTRKITQSVKFQRTATITADGKVTYSDYQAIGHDSFNSVFVAKHAGYQLKFSDGSQKISRIDHVTADTPVQDITVTYVKSGN